jgi:hypothetical protein
LSTAWPNSPLLARLSLSSETEVLNFAEFVIDQSLLTGK